MSQERESSSVCPQIAVTPARALIDTPLDVHLTGFAARQKITARAQTTDSMEIVWESKAVYEASADGQVDLNTQAPVSGAYKNPDAMGLIWSMTPQDKASAGVMFACPADLSPLRVTFEALVDSEVVASTQAERLQHADGVQRIVVRENGLFGTLFLPPGDGPHPAITLVSGSGGGLWENVAARHASHGYAGFALAYFRYETLPKILVDIPLEYFETAINYLQARDDIDGQRLGIAGASRGGELSLLLGSLFPQYKVVIADVPSGIVWSGFGHDLTEGHEPAWLYRGEAIAYMDDEFDPEIYAYYDEYTERGEAIPSTPAFLELMRRGAATMKKAEIPIEKINGAVLMISGEDDQMWPSTQFANIAMDRLKAHNFEKPYIHLSYREAGHFIPPPYQPTTAINMKHPVDGGFYTFGGKPEANYRAGIDSWQKRLEFLKTHL